MVIGIEASRSLRLILIACTAGRETHGLPTEAVLLSRKLYLIENPLNVQQCCHTRLSLYDPRYEAASVAVRLGSGVRRNSLHAGLRHPDNLGDVINNNTNGKSAVFDDGDLTGDRRLRQRKRRAHVNDRDYVTSQIDNTEYMGRGGRDWENLLGNNDFRQEFDGYGIRILANTEETNSYLFFRQ
jgi:hypothetical protein